MANIKFSDFTNQIVDATATRLVGFKDGDTTTNYMYDVGQIAVGMFANPISSNLTLESSAADLIFEMDNNAANSANFQIINGSGNNRADLHLDSNVHITMKGQRVGIVQYNPSYTLDVTGDGHFITTTTPQLTLSYDVDSFATISVAAASNTTLAVGESGTFTLDVAGNVTIDSDTGVITFSDGGASLATITSLRQESFIMACSDETTALTVGTDKATFRMPYAFTLTAVRASLTTAGTGGNLVTVDIHETGTTILSTKITIDATETTSVTAATPPVISDASLADDAEMTVDIDQIDSGGVSAGLKVTLIGYQTP